MRISALLAFFIACWPAFSGPADAANLTMRAIDGATARVLVEGEIVKGDANELSALIESSRTSPLRVAAVSFNSGGGNLLEGYKLAQAIQRARLATEVEKGNVCASACFFAFAAGATKTAAPGARIGVHGAADANGERLSEAPAATIIIARWAIKALGVPSEIIGKMVTTPPNAIAWLSNSELESMGVRILDDPSSALSQPVPLGNGEIGGANASNDWSELVNSAIELSTAQNNGVIQAHHFCASAANSCEWSVDFRLADKNLATLRTLQDRNGKTISRKYCLVEPSGDLRRCIDWDTRKRSEEQKSANGVWATMK